MLTFSKSKAWSGSKFYHWHELHIMIHKSSLDSSPDEDILRILILPISQYLIFRKKKNLVLKVNRLMKGKKTMTGFCHPPRNHWTPVPVERWFPATDTSGNLHAYVAVLCYHFLPHGPRVMTVILACGKNIPEPYVCPTTTQCLYSAFPFSGCWYESCEVQWKPHTLQLEADHEKWELLP